MYWNYNNVFKGYNNHVNGLKGRTTLTGYWTFQMLTEKLKEDGITLKANKVNGKCSVLHDDLLFLGRLGELLGFRLLP